MVTLQNHHPVPDLAPYSSVGYVKLWQLEGAQMMEHYDVILIDEASDFTPGMQTNTQLNVGELPHN